MVSPDGPRDRGTRGARPTGPAHWDERYAQPGFAFGSAPNDFLVSVAARIPRGRVLCLAEGEGRNAVYLAGLGHEVLAVDQSRVGLAKARALAETRGVRIATEVADLGEYRIPPGAFDGVVSIFAHLPPGPRLRLHAQVVAGLRPGGVVAVEAYRPEQLGRGTGGPPTPDRFPTLAALRRELAGLRIEIAREIERDVLEGRYHTGRAAVVQLLARRPAGS